MPWHVPVAVRMAMGYVAVPILLKPLVDRYARAPLLLAQFAGCFALALVLTALGQASLDWTIVAVGGVNGLAAYCYHQAIAMGLSRTALFAFWDDPLAMGLSSGLLGEGRFLNPRIILGIVVSVSAVVLFVGPALAGLYVFGEREALDRPEQLYFTVGLVGGVLVAPSCSWQIPGADGAVGGGSWTPSHPEVAIALAPHAARDGTRARGPAPKGRWIWDANTAPGRSRERP